MRFTSIAVLLIALMSCGIAVAQTTFGDMRGSVAPATYAGSASGAPAYGSRATYDDRQQSVLILDGAMAAPSTGGVLPVSATSPMPSAAVYPSGPQYVPGQPPMYQAGQQFQLYDGPRMASAAAPVSYGTMEAPALAPGTIVPDYIDYSQEPWRWQIVPPGLIWHSYLAGPKEPRISGVLESDTGVDTKLDGTVGGRVGLLRYGNSASFRPQGFQIDAEGAAFVREDLTQNSDVDGYDFRIGFPVTYAWDQWLFKFSWYHTSSHLGDEFELKHPLIHRINYSRNALVWALAYYLTDDIRIYGEVDYGYWTDGGNLPWAFQFGWEYSPVVRGAGGAPFAAMNVYMRQENDFGGPFTVEAGWQWRPERGGQLIRTGFFYQNGPSILDQFFRDSEQLIGYGLWYDY